MSRSNPKFTRPTSLCRWWWWSRQRWWWAWQWWWWRWGGGSMQRVVVGSWLSSLNAFHQSPLASKTLTVNHSMVIIIVCLCFWLALGLYDLIFYIFQCLDSFASNTLTQSVILYLNWNFYNTIDFIVFQDFFSKIWSCNCKMHFLSSINLRKCTKSGNILKEFCKTLHCYEMRIWSSLAVWTLK